MENLNSTPNANRLHIALYGRRNSGKSSLINAMTGQQTALVSDVAGTTADPVWKAMEVRGLGACVLIDTAGFDDEGKLGTLRVEKTLETLPKADLAVLVFGGESADGFALEREWLEKLNSQRTPVVSVLNRWDLGGHGPLLAQIKAACNVDAVSVSAKTGQGVSHLLAELARMLPEDYGADSVTARFVKDGDVVLLVMPQDSEAPKGRLILPQVQTIRDLLDNRCIVVGVTPETMDQALTALKEPPALVITDSQVFKAVSEKTPPQSRLTSFSVLFAAHKGDLDAFVQGARAVDTLTEHSKVLIAEACTHAPLSEDIGRVKIPAMLRKRFGSGLTVEVASGKDFPKDLSGYDLIVHCGGCMFNRRFLLSRVERAKGAGIPITNYGVLIAKLSGILDQIAL